MAGPPARRRPDVPGQARQPGPVPTAATTRSGRTRTVSAGSAAGRAGRRAVRRRRDGRRSTGVRLGARSWGCAGPGCADPHQDQAVLAAETGQCGVGASCGQHGGASGQDGVQPDRWAVTGGHQRVGDRAAGPQRGGMPEGRSAAGMGAGRGPEARVAVEPMAWQMETLRTAAARAIRRTAAARSCPPVIAQPTRTAFFTRAVACGRRSLSYVSSRSSPARPVKSWASFQARLSASRSPPARPCQLKPLNHAAGSR